MGGDPVSLHQILSLGAALQVGGPILAVLVIWYFGDKSRERDLKAYREDTNKILSSYQADMLAMRQMYDNNVLLVKNYQALCGDLKEIVMINSKGFQSLDDSIKRKCAALRD